MPGRHFPLVLVLLASPGLACPKMLGDGVAVLYEDGGLSVFTAGEVPGTILERALFPDEQDGFETLSWYGLYPLHEIQFDLSGPLDQTEERWVYTRPPPQPEPGQPVLEIKARVTTPHGEDLRGLEVVTGPMGELAVGACRYPAFSAEVGFLDPDPDLSQRRYFQVIPALGIAVQTGSQDRFETETYLPVQITAHTAMPD